MSANVTSFILSLPDREDGSSLDETQISTFLRSVLPARDAVAKFNIPANLRSGTLDQLMVVSKELQRIDLVAEQLVSKLQQTYAELEVEDELLVKEDQTPWDYLTHFSWEGRFDKRSRLADVCRRIAERVQKIDDGFRTVTSNYRDAETAVNALRRKKSGNLLAADLKDILTVELVRERTQKLPQEYFKETAYTKTVVVIITKSNRSEFEMTYEHLCSNLVPLHSPDREDEFISPIVPGSHKLLYQEPDDGYLLYSVTLLKGPKDAFVTAVIKAAREKRWVVRNYTPPMVAEGEEVDTLLKQEATAQANLDKQKGNMTRRCANFYDEAFVIFTHIKAIRVFVESKLRYGLDGFFSFVLQVGTSKAVSKLKGALGRKFRYLDAMGVSSIVMSDNVKRIMGDREDEYLPYVLVPLV